MVDTMTIVTNWMFFKNYVHDWFLVLMVLLRLNKCLTNWSGRNYLIVVITIFTALMVYKCLNGLAPEYLQNNFELLCNHQERVTRQSTAGLLALPLRRNGNDIQCFKYSFRYNGVKIWNGLESAIRNSPNTQMFLKTIVWLFLVLSVGFYLFMFSAIFNIYLFMYNEGP